MKMPLHGMPPTSSFNAQGRPVHTEESRGRRGAWSALANVPVSPNFLGLANAVVDADMNPR